MKNPVRIITLGFAILFLTAGAIAYFGLFEVKISNSVFIALSLNFINSLAAFIFFEKSYNKSNQNYLLLNLGGMGIRMIFMLSVIAIVIKFLNIDKFAFILLFFIFYFLLLSLEVAHFIKRTGKKERRT